MVVGASAVREDAAGDVEVAVAVEVRTAVGLYSYRKEGCVHADGWCNKHRRKVSVISFPVRRVLGE